MSYVICPHKITSPVAHLSLRHPMPSNIPCDSRCRVTREAEVMSFICARGHHFIAGRKDIQEDA